MPLKPHMPIGLAALVAVTVAAVPALADVKAGVDAWSRGDYSSAVRQWQGPADAGDADAMFNLAQAYRLGRGVAADAKRAENLYARAAAAGHAQAADTYGLMLFQDGRRQQALPYLQDAARRGDPRSQYLLGIAHFNGDMVPKDWTRAYALVTLANAEGLPQAGQALAQMDEHIPLEQRQQAQALAQQLRAEATAARTAQLASADLAAREPARPAPQPQPVAAARIAAPIPSATVAVSPSIAAARAAVEAASRATGTESPADAGASFARPRAPALVQRAVSPAPAPSSIAAPAPVPSRVATLAPVQVARAEPAAGRAAPVASTSGAWRVQLGAFAVAGNAQKLWDRLSGRSELAGKQRLLVATGGMTRLQAGGFASKAAAEGACRSLRQAGEACLVSGG